MTSSVAILFVDIAGSTALYERLGNARAKGLVTACLQLLREEVLKRAGEVVQAIGDELMCRFANAQTACAAAVAMQERISARDLASPCPSRFALACSGARRCGKATTAVVTPLIPQPVWRTLPRAGRS
jgi:class 3 adenylate cyclase